MVDGKYVNDFGGKRNVYMLNWVEYKLRKLFVKEIKVDGLLKCSREFIMMKVCVLVDIW